MTNDTILTPLLGDVTPALFDEAAGIVALAAVMGVMTGDISSQRGADIAEALVVLQDTIAKLQARDAQAQLNADDLR